MKRSLPTHTFALSAALLCLLLPGQPAPSAQPRQDKPLPSPAAVAETRLNGKALVIHYNTPSMRGREIMGGLVPYGKVWRTGANPATSFTTEPT